MGSNAHELLHAGNYNTYSPTRTGSGATGTWGIGISGNAATATIATNSNQLGGIAAALYAQLASPALTGSPTAPTPTNGDISTKVATTAFVEARVGSAVAANIVGTTGYIARFTSASAIGNSSLFASGSNIGIGTTNPAATLDVNGGLRAGGQTVVTICNVSTEGTQRYNYLTRGIEFCNGTSWTTVVSSGLCLAGSYSST